MDDIKSTSGYVFSLGTKVVSCNSKKQHRISLSSIELEYKATIKGECEVI